MMHSKSALNYNYRIFPFYDIIYIFHCLNRISHCLKKTEKHEVCFVGVLVSLTPGPEVIKLFRSYENSTAHKCQHSQR